MSGLAQLVRGLAAKPEDLSSKPTPTRWKDRTGSRKFSSELHAYTVAGSALYQVSNVILKSYSSHILLQVDV